MEQYSNVNNKSMERLNNIMGKTETRISELKDRAVIQHEQERQ